MKITIREATPEDLDVPTGFNARMALETEDKRLDPVVIAAGVHALLADPDEGRQWLAECGGGIAGQIMVTCDWNDWRNGMLWWVQSVYVHEDFRREGVFSTLYRHVESLARNASHVAGIRLQVRTGNARAQATYEKLGMTSTG